MNLADNIEVVSERIEKAAVKSGRTREDIHLVAATKMQSIEKLLDAYNCGLKVFGENKVQELIEKYPHIMDVSWHFIGHLQKNKVKYIIDKVDMIHSVDNLELAQEINKRASKINKIMPVLIQINIGREATKSGIVEDQLDELCGELSKLESIKVQGLMAIPPAEKAAGESRGYFKQMKNLYERLAAKDYREFDIKYLSMGMTGDFEEAIEEGANIIRVGTGIFGKRNYTGGKNDVKEL
jgi:pyridoxal phosphate enzyme (YggS family)